MTEILLLLILIALMVLIFLNIEKVSRKPKVRKLTKEELRKVEQTKRELNNFYAYNGDSQAE